MAFPEFFPLKVAAFGKAAAISIAAICMTGLNTSAYAQPVQVFAKDNIEPVSKSALRVSIDRAKVVRIAKAADTIIIGNPGIVDATVQDARTLVLTGRTFGVTNIIILDAEGDAIVDEEVVVIGKETNLVRVYRQDERETMTCAPICEGTVTVGDHEKYFTRVTSQTSLRNGLAAGK